MFEICLKRGWSVPARATLDLCKMAERKMSVCFEKYYPCLTSIDRWGSMTPLRQFRAAKADIIRKAEAKQFVCVNLGSSFVSVAYFECSAVVSLF